MNINLKSSAPKYVVEGNITDQSGPYFVKITRSVNFDQDNVFPQVSGAKVVITDNNSGQTDTLQELTPGNYQTSVLNGIPGHNYSLYINAAGKVLTSNCTMPMPVTLDSLYSEVAGFRGKNISVIPVYFDPIKTGNFYHFTVIKNDTLTNAINVRNDALVNGQVIQQPISTGGNVGKLIPGDIVTVSLECIDSMVYQFYYTLRQSQNENAATPTNPVSNISGGQSLGYFSAHTVSSKTIIIPF